MKIIEYAVCACVCAQVVGNIRGGDAATYLGSACGDPGDSGDADAGELGPLGALGDDEPSRCTCGFSAIVNRRLAHRAGLFYEVTRPFICYDYIFLIVPK